MTLARGTHVGPYEVLAALGRGGMGEVYRARDSKLDRLVAIKILPESFAHDADRLARFKREAKTLAALNHPHVATVHGFQETDGVHVLVMEVVEGPTLAERIARGPIPADESWAIAAQVAEALEAAHEQGIIHRDPKPANIKVKADGTVKVLDFGLAKAIEPTASEHDLSQSPTLTAAGTRAGVLLGTAAYMSPEQARGRPVDKRTDIWAFGCVLYEMLAGRPAFSGVDVSEVLASVIKSDVDWRALPANTPAAVATLLRRCLEKETKLRLRDIGDARIVLHECAAADTAHRESSAMAPAKWRHRVAWFVTAIAAIGAIATAAFILVPRGRPDDRVYQSSILLPAGSSLTGIPSARFCLSPDGRQLVFVATSSRGRSRLFVRPLAESAARELPDTEGASSPFWSPDSRFIGFYAGGKLNKVDAAGGPPVALADTSGNPGGSWNRANVILFANTGARSGGIRRVAASGGAVTEVTTLDTGNGEVRHTQPFFLPDGRHFLYTTVGSKSEGPNAPNGIHVGSLDSTARRFLLPGGSNAKYAQGHLLFLRGQTLMAQEFDPDRIELKGEPRPIVDQVTVGGIAGRNGAYSVSDTGVLAYQVGPAGDMSPGELVWFDRAGKQIESFGGQADYGDLALSPDGKRVAVSIFDTARLSRDVWLVDLANGFKTHFTFDPANDFTAVWSPDARAIVFDSDREGRLNLFRKASSGAGAEELLQASTGSESPLDWSRDGRFLLYSRVGPATQSDLWVLPLIGDRKPFAFLQSRFSETEARFSPDGRWVAYTSNELGDGNEVYVRAFSGTGGPWQVSTAGGTQPRWRADGAEVFYVAPDNRLMAAAVDGRGSGFHVGAVQPLFETSGNPGRRSMYDVAPDGRRFLINSRVDRPESSSITLIVNWTGLRN